MIIVMPKNGSVKKKKIKDELLDSKVGYPCESGGNTK